MTYTLFLPFEYQQPCALLDPRHDIRGRGGRGGGEGRGGGPPLDPPLMCLFSSFSFVFLSFLFFSFLFLLSIDFLISEP